MAPIAPKQAVIEPPILLLLTLLPSCSPRPSPFTITGQEEVDDIIRRDIHRTFPEHPLFCSDEGEKNDAQESLFKVLKVSCGEVGEG